MSHKELSSEAVPLGKSKCGTKTCDSDSYCAAQKCVERSTARSWLGWLLYGLVGLAGLTLLLAIVGAFMGRGEREHIASQERAAAIMQQQQAQQGDVRHRIVAQGPQGQSIAPQSAQAPRSRGPVQPQGPISGVGPGGMVHQQAAATDQPTASGFIMVMAGPGAGTKVPLRHGFNIGTGRACDLTISDAAAATYHAQIVFDAGGGCLLMDRGSPTGTFVNGTRINQMRLVHGATIKIGSTELRYVMG